MGDASVVRLEGALTMRTIAAALDRPLPEGDFVVDMSGVTEADSAALALLLEWLRRTGGKRFVVQGAPAGLQSLVQLYGLDEILPLAA